MCQAGPVRPTCRASIVISMTRGVGRLTRGGEADVWGPPNKAEEGGEEERGGAAMADKPSRGLVLYAAGHAALLPPASGGGGGAGGGGGGSHLDAFASLASCGFLSLRSPPLASGYY